MYISVIITCFNLENYINTCIESVINQNFDKCLYELIVVDDCSTDNSPSIINKYKNIKYIKTEKNSGVLLATLKGLEASSYEIICFLDGDDVWHKEKLSKVYDKFRNDESLIFMTHNYNFINENGKNIAGQEKTQKIYLKNRNINQLIKNGILYKKNYVWLGSAYSIKIYRQQLDEFSKWVKELPSPELTYQDWPLAFWVALRLKGNFSYDFNSLFSYRVPSSNYGSDTSTYEKLLKNHTKTCNTSHAIFQLAQTYSTDSDLIKSTRSIYIKDELILRSYQSTKKITYLEIFKNINCFNTSRNNFKELIKILILKIFGIQIFFNVKNIFKIIFNFKNI